MYRALARIDHEIATLTTQIDARIEEFIRTKADTVRRSIEESIERFESQKAEKTQARLYAERETEELTELAGDDSLLRDYQQAIRSTLATVDDDERSAKAAEILKTLLAGIALGTENIRVSLAPVNRATQRVRVCSS